MVDYTVNIPYQVFIDVPRPVEQIVTVTRDVRVPVEVPRPVQVDVPVPVEVVREVVREVKVYGDARAPEQQIGFAPASVVTVPSTVASTPFIPGTPVMSTNNNMYSVLSGF